MKFGGVFDYTDFFMPNIIIVYQLVVEPTPSKNMLVKMGFIFPKVQGENQKIFELPPPSMAINHLQVMRWSSK